MSAPRPVAHRGAAVLPALMALAGTVAAPSWPVALLAVAVVAVSVLRLGVGPAAVRGRRR